MNALNNMLEAMDIAGYVADAEEFKACYDAGPFWLMVTANDDEGTYIVGRFFKATLTKGADFEGVPVGEFDFYEEAMDCFNANK